MVGDCTLKEDEGAEESGKGTNTNKGKKKSFIKNKAKNKFQNKKQEINNSNREFNKRANRDNSKKDIGNNVKCVYFNARSIVNKQKELNLLISEEDLDIIGITETWLNDKILDE